MQKISPVRFNERKERVNSEQETNWEGQQDQARANGREREGKREGDREERDGQADREEEGKAKKLKVK